MRTAEHVQHDGGGVEVGGRARVVARVLAPRAVDDEVAHLQPRTHRVNVTDTMGTTYFICCNTVQDRT